MVGTQLLLSVSTTRRSRGRRPDSRDRCGNMASIMTVHEDGTRTFAVYDAAEENERDRGKIAGRMVCHLLLQHLNSLMHDHRICHILCNVGPCILYGFVIRRASLINAYPYISPDISAPSSPKDEACQFWIAHDKKILYLASAIPLVDTCSQDVSSTFPQPHDNYQNHTLKMHLPPCLPS